MLSINDILISDSFIWLYSYSSIVGKMAETVCIFPLTKGFIALYGYSVIFKTLSPLGDSKLCFR